ncbi:MAG: GAF domain-containing protein [Candidatus Rokubacteria bacterium]|nr:GAF domain-containing protein [Candidatus Rokubacteria bacterium]
MTDRHEVVARLSRVVRSGLDPDRTLEAIGEAARELFAAPGVFFWLADEPARRLDLRLLVPADLRADMPYSSMSYDEGVAGWVARERRILHVPQVAEDPRALSGDWWKRHGFQGALVVPIVSDGVLLGVLSIVARAAFRDGDPALAEELAAHAAAALENAAVLARSEARRRAAEGLAEVGRLLSQTLDPETVGQRVTESVCRLLAVRSASLYRFAPDGMLVAETIFSAADFPWMRVLTPDVGIAGLALRERQPVSTPDLLTDERLTYSDRFKSEAAQTAHRALLAVPLVVQGRDLGVLAAGDQTGRRFTDDDVRLVQAFADQAAVALENARLYREASRLATRMRALAEVERLLSETLDAGSITRRIVETLGGLIDARVATLFRADGDDFVIAAVAGDVGPTVVTSVRFPAGQGLVALAARARRAVQTPNLLADPRVELNPELRRVMAGAHYAAILSAPLVVNDRVIGVLSVGDDAGRIFDEDDIRLVQAFADQAARALENARLYEEAGIRRREAEELAQVAAAITGSLDVAAVLPRVLEAARRLTGAELSRLALRDPARDVMVFRFADGAAVEHPDVARGTGPAGEAWATGRAIRTDERWPEAAAPGVRAQIVVPIVVGGVVEGLLSVANRSARGFTPRHQEVLQRLADQAAIAMHTARLFADEQAARAAAQAAAQALRDSEAVRQRAMEVGQIGSWISGIGDGSRLEWSQEVCRIFGVDPGVLTGTSEDFVARVYPDDLPDVIAARNEALATGGPLRIDHRIVRPDGAIRWVHERADIQRDPDGRPARFIGVVQDITERKQAEEALQAAEEQLRQSQKMDAIGRLAGGVAHDFNNLLSIITGRSELILRARELPGAVRRDVDLIHRTAERAASLTRQLLAFSRKQLLQPKVIDVNGVVSNMGRMLRRVIGEDVDLVIVARPGVARVNADPGQLEQVILNLAVNARDAMPGGGRLTIETAQLDLDAEHAKRHPGVGPGRHVMLAVSDTGIGMDAATRERIFEPFFTTKDVGKGTGLGLSTVYGIVQQSGGTVWVYSEPGHGSVFKIYFPGVDDAVPEDTTPEPAPRGGSETVLVCEDEPDLRELAREVLQELGYQVLEAGDGKQALEVSARHAGPIHLLVTDVVMPRMNGSELATRLVRERPLRVLYMSGYTETSMAGGGPTPGARFLQKPFSPVVLARAVREVLDSTPA